MKTIESASQSGRAKIRNSLHFEDPQGKLAAD